MSCSASTFESEPSPARTIPAIAAVKTVIAVQHIRRMRGGSQAHLMRCSDGEFYVVKFRNNPQHPRVLANEFLATRLAASLGLPVPWVAVVTVDEWLVAHTPELAIQLGNTLIPCEAGLHFGSQLVVHPVRGRVFDYLPMEMLPSVRNVEAFAGMLAFDKWTYNADGRQAAFWRTLREKKYTASFIDQGYCFNAGEWSFPDHPLRGTYWKHEVYAPVQGWESFEPWLSRIENISEEAMVNLADGIPPQWYGADWQDLEALLSNLLLRRRIVRELIAAFRDSSRNPFPQWRFCQ